MRGELGGASVILHQPGRRPSRSVSKKRPGEASPQAESRRALPRGWAQGRE